VAALRLRMMDFIKTYFGFNPDLRPKEINIELECGIRIILDTLRPKPADIGLLLQAMFNGIDFAIQDRVCEFKQQQEKENKNDD